ncbi:MAG: hypothetical protein WD048_04735 [Chitinophagales bacterium]
MNKLISISILALILLSSCKDFNDFSPHTQFILKNEQMMFRGIEFDINKATVLETEASEPTEEYPDYLLYNYQLNEQDEPQLELEYFFNNDNRLDMIIAYYTLENEEEKARVFDELIREFTKRFGPGEKDELGWYTWKFKDQIGIPGQIEIILNPENTDGFRGIDIEFVKYYEFEQDMGLEEERAG